VTKRNVTVIVSDSTVSSGLPAPADRRLTNLFVYGSLADPRRLDDVLGYRFGGERLRAQLHGFFRARVDAYEYPFLMPREGGVVDGILIYGLDLRDMAVLDRYEDVDSGFYSRTRVQDVEVWGCGPHPMQVVAEAYVAGPALLKLTGLQAAQAGPSTTS
jgi:gamma-glutamylcyclotransferase (GGCT)/AIG2-like uncharacterized protein YtfP